MTQCEIVILDRRQAEESQTFIADLETIDDDLSARDVNMVKISDLETAEEYGIEDLPAVVYFENGIPFVYMGMYEIISKTDFFEIFPELQLQTFFA